MKKHKIGWLLLLVAANTLQGTTISNSTTKENVEIISLPSGFVSNREKFQADIEYMIAAAEKEKREKELERKRLEEEAIQAEKMRILNVEYYNWDLVKVSGITHEEMYEVLSDTSMSHLAWAIVEAERTHGVNAFFLAAVIALESTWATSDRAVYSNNLTGMAVYGDDSPGENYVSQDECVMDTARQLKKYYLTVGGDYFNGISSDSVNIRYSADPNWYLKVNKIAYDLSYDYDIIFKGE